MANKTQREYSEYARNREKWLLTEGYYLAGESVPGSPAIGEVLNNLIRMETKKREYIIVPLGNGHKIYCKDVNLQISRQQSTRDIIKFILR